MKQNKTYLTGLIFLMLALVAPSLAAVPREQCIGVDNRDCKVLEYGICEYIDTKERGVLVGKHQICDPQKQTDKTAGLVNVISYDDSAKLGENMSLPTGQVDDRQCDEHPKVDGIPQEVWNQTWVLQSAISNQFWIMKKMKDEQGECTISIFPVVKIIQPNTDDKYSNGKIIFDETKPVLRIYKPQNNISLDKLKITQQQKPSIVSVKSTTPGFAKVDDLISSYYYVLSSQSGDAQIATLFYAGRKYAKKNSDKPAPWNNHFFETYFNYIRRDTEKNKYSSTPCLSRDAIVPMSLSSKNIEHMQQFIDSEAQFKNANYLMSLERCPGTSDINFRN